MKLYTLGVIASVAACAPQQSSYQPSAYAQEVEGQNAISLANYKKLSEAVRSDYTSISGNRASSRNFCKPETFAPALSNIEALRNYTPVRYADWEMRKQTETRVESGRALVQLGKLAQDRKCNTEARSLYTQVIEAYEGDIYAALRQRAQVGIDDLRHLR